MDYTLMKNSMSKKKGDSPYIARARVNSMVTFEQVITRLAHASTLTEADINGVLTGLEKILIDYIVLGHSVDVKFFKIGYSIKGRFESQEDNFTEGRNWININSTITRSFGDAINQLVKPTKLIAENKVPSPLKLIKVSGDLTLPEVKPGNLVQISGTRLSFDKTDLETGVFLHTDSGDEIRVSEYAKNGDTLIFLKMPDGLTAGNNSVEVRGKSSDGKITRGFLIDPVIIAA